MTDPQQQAMPEPLPCPFCGGDPRISRMCDESLWSHDDVVKTSVRCDGCDVATSYTEEGQDPEAIEIWNTRALAVSAPSREVPELPNPGSPEASVMIDSMLAQYHWPSNPKNAARAGYEAARRMLSTPVAAE